MEGLIIRPRVAELALIRGIPAPQRFTINDLRPEAAKKEAASLVLELPQEISVVGDYESKTVAHGGAAYRRYEFPLKRAGKKQDLLQPDALPRREREGRPTSRLRLRAQRRDRPVQDRAAGSDRHPSRDSALPATARQPVVDGRDAIPKAGRTS